MSLAAQVIASAEAAKAEDGRYPVMFLPSEEFAALLAECQAPGGNRPVRLRGIIVKPFDVERAGTWAWGINQSQQRR